MLKNNCTTSCLLVMIDRCFMGSKRSDWHLLTNVHRLAVDVNVRLIIELRSSLVRLIAKKKKKKNCLPVFCFSMHWSPKCFIAVQSIVKSNLCVE